MLVFAVEGPGEVFWFLRRHELLRLFWPFVDLDVFGEGVREFAAR